MWYWQIKFLNVNEAEQEILLAKLIDEQFLGFEQESLSLSCYAPRDFRIDPFLDEWNMYSIETKEIKERNWNAEWEKSIEPIIVDGKIGVRADFHRPLDTPHEIVITPKMSFGTGHHQTTQLMLHIMTGLDFDQKSVLDYGTGTGILAIYAEMMGAQKIRANDIDEWSIENAKENGLRNHCRRIELFKGDLDILPLDKYDIILANINLNVIRKSYTYLVEDLLSERGICVFSGILDKDRDEIFNLFNMYQFDIEWHQKDSWLAFSLKCKK